MSRCCTFLRIIKVGVILEEMCPSLEKETFYHIKKNTPIDSTGIHNRALWLTMDWSSARSQTCQLNLRASKLAGVIPGAPISLDCTMKYHFSFGSPHISASYTYPWFSSSKSWSEPGLPFFILFLAAVLFLLLARKNIILVLFLIPLLTVHLG